MGKIFCSICKNAYDSKVPLPSSVSDQKSINSFVVEGFCNWKKATERFKIHESSTMHKASLYAKINTESGTNVAASLSKGLAIRGHTDESSNLCTLLKLRAEDSPELSSWLGRTKYKWLSHDVINEIIHLFSENIIENILTNVRHAKYYSIMIDETQDMATREQVSICIRVLRDGHNNSRSAIQNHSRCFT
ncbi:hypothetical protein NQ315_003367 [Exocentrus adspersus]|uniref:DUF4371 domain-containing protein n=1 Tax=Exocentrus adspersus TaxID=1586481 RepID=A0AAV8VAP2_9CUCU|nr:hypothetical protein NQ315_003367 [Exocentrus adspersus]